MKLKNLGLLTSTTLLSIALLASCSGDDSSNQDTTVPNNDTVGEQGLTGDNNQAGGTNADDVLDLDTGNDDVPEVEDGEAPEGEAVLPDDVVATDPDVTPPEDAPHPTPDAEVPPTPEAPPETPPTTPEAPPEAPAVPQPEAPAPAPETDSAPAPEAPPSSSSVDLTAFYHKVTGSYEFSMMQEVTGEYLVNLFSGLNAVSTNQRQVYMAMMSATALEIALIEVTNASDVDNVKAILQSRINSQAEGGAWYPEAMESWKNNSAVVSNGNYVMMVAHPNHSSIVADFNALF